MNPFPGSIPLPRYDHCFVCGKANPIGLDLTFYYHEDRIKTRFSPLPHHAGYQGIVHGGILATILDECMGWTCILSREVMCVAADLSIRYKSPAKVGHVLYAVSELMEDRKRLILAAGHVEDESGTVVAKGEGKFVPLSREDRDRVIQYAGWEDAIQRVYQRIRADREKPS